MSIIEKITKEIINKLIFEFSKEENKSLINCEIIRPLVLALSNSIIKEFYPFILIGITIFILTFLFAFIIMIIIIKKI